MEMARLEQEVRISIGDFKRAELQPDEILNLFEVGISDRTRQLYFFLFAKGAKAETVTIRDLCRTFQIHRSTLWKDKTQLEDNDLLIIDFDKDFLIWKILPPSKNELCLSGETLRLSEEELRRSGETLRLVDSESPNKDSPIEPITSMCISNASDISLCISSTICPENSNKPPKLSKKTVCKVSDLEFLDENFPYDSSLQVSVIWYWAFKRHQLHRLDQVFNGALFGQMAKKYSHLLRVIGKDDWEAHKKYVDWYLAQESEFIKDECKYNFEYFSSLNCYNKSLSAPTEYYVSTEEERNQHKGVWIRD